MCCGGQPFHTFESTSPLRVFNRGCPWRPGALPPWTTSRRLETGSGASGPRAPRWNDLLPTALPPRLQHVLFAGSVLDDHGANYAVVHSGHGLHHVEGLAVMQRHTRRN